MAPSKLRNRVFLGKCSKWNSKFQNWSKSLCLGISETTKRLPAQSTANSLRNWQGKQVFVKENEKKKRKKMKKKSKSVKSLSYMDESFFPTNDFSLRESCQRYIIAKYKASQLFWNRGSHPEGPVKKVFLKILQNSQENPCARVSFLIE